MRGMMSLAAVAAMAAGSIGSASAAEEQVKLQVELTGCSSCAYIVKKTIARVEGVKAVDLSYEDDILTCDVVFENSQTDVAALITAVADTGYESRAIE